VEKFSLTKFCQPGTAQVLIGRLPCDQVCHHKTSDPPRAVKQSTVATSTAPDAIGYHEPVFCGALSVQKMS
jgi:hypothetical protein